MDAAALFRSLPRASDAPIPEATSIFYYKDERVSHLVWSIKYKKSHKGALLAAHALFRILCSFESVVPEEMLFLVVPMPIAKARRRERGFNQCELIIDEIKQLDVDKRMMFDIGLLMRVRHTSRQTLKDRRERLESIQKIFAVNEKAAATLANKAVAAGNAQNEIVRGLESFFVVIIDDVITTGSTMKDAVETLRQAGFVHSYGLSFAH